mmetsp:Transcript_10528/g.16960  ORF Transcript_10528/g.16960 Transcript_10528/m.16960 type:complete len:89 (-) Transcript_10528:66-332(-)
MKSRRTRMGFCMSNTVGSLLLGDFRMGCGNKYIRESKKMCLIVAGNMVTSISSSGDTRNLLLPDGTIIHHFANQNKSTGLFFVVPFHR